MKIMMLRIGFLLLYTSISLVFNRIVPQPYMDEIFHIPQAQEYCLGNWHSWDPMITTFPGLYLFSVAISYITFPFAHFIGLVSTISEICTVSFLRFTNVLLALLSLELFYRIHSKLDSSKSDAVSKDHRNAVIKTSMCCLFPLHFFFTFLYYTDVGSTAAVLAMYLSAIHKSYFIAAIMGVIAILFRQTNIIWIVLVMSEGVIDLVVAMSQSECDSVFNISSNGLTKKDENSSDGLTKNDDSLSNLNNSDLLRKRKKKQKEWNGEKEHFQNLKEMETQRTPFFEILLSFVQICWKVKFKILKIFLPFFAIIFSFVVFVYVNQGIVLGAKEHHRISAHLAQVLYFLAFSSVNLLPLFFSPGQIFSNIKKVLSLRKSKPVSSFFIFFISVCSLFIIVRYFSPPHPYLLADNRHYPFYIWKRIISKNRISKFCLIPVYLYSGFSLTQLLLKSNNSSLWILFYYCTTTLVLIPSPLLEFRYFTVPFLILLLRLNSDALGSNKQTMFVISCHVLVNVITIYSFLFKPFRWQHEQGLQRFMW